MININKLQTTNHKILAIGSHRGILQSMLDFEYLSGKEKTQVVAIIGFGKSSERYFFGKKEMLIPVYESISALPESLKEQITLFLNARSARRVLDSTKEALELPHLMGGVIFAEDVPERHAIELATLSKKTEKFLIGPASVGILLPSLLKLGAIGGVDARQLLLSHLMTKGSVAVFSASGGMTNELIRVVAQNGKRVSFALHFGGDRFPLTTPEEALLMAEEDPETKAIVYHGELGGTDEYAIAELLKEKKITKPVVCYIGGVISELFETPPQFGHAKALAGRMEETASAKRKVLTEAGAKVGNTFSEFVELIKGLPEFEESDEKAYDTRMDDITNRRAALITTSISKDQDGEATILQENLLDFAKTHSFAYEVISMFLGKKVSSKELETFVDFILRLLVDHGPYVSGAMNTIITARAGKDLVSSLSAGLLTIGPRFGGAINEAAGNWIRGVGSSQTPDQFVEEFVTQKKYILGIGHKKYRTDFPDPRVVELLTFTKDLSKKQYTNFALEVEKITSSKKGNLILNVDGAIAAVLLDILSEKEGMSTQQLQKLIDIEFFNALFVLSRSVGFISHFLDQKRLDEGLFRLDDDLVAEVTNE